jgi:hypothetical protein
VIKPTIGRVVWFWDRSADMPRQPQAHAALVTYVHSDTMVNLVVFDAGGNSHPRTSVHLLQEDCEAPVGPYCEWMPYQKGQAAKTEALETAAAARAAGPTNY